jgi:hypothetical protein
LGKDASSLSPELAERARSAPFVFIGTVRRPGDSNVEALDREDEQVRPDKNGIG